MVDHFTNGDLGVLLFFVLSGFLITYLIIDELNRTGKFSIKAFYIRRVLRIWPLYFFICLLGFIVLPNLIDYIGNDYYVLDRELDNEISYLVYYATFLGNFVNAFQMGFRNEVITVLWSVSIEEQFYLSLPLIFLISHNNLTKIALILTSLVIISLVFRYCYVSDNYMLKMNTASVMAGLLVGCLMAIIINRFDLTRQKVNINIALNYILHLVFVLVIFFRERIFTSAYWIIIEVFVFSIGFAFVIFNQTSVKNAVFPLYKNRFLSNLGKYTYGLYCYHFIGLIVAGILIRLFENYIFDLSYFLEYFLVISFGFGITIGFALASYHFLESPFLKLKKSLVR